MRITLLIVIIGFLLICCHSNTKQDRERIEIPKDTIIVEENQELVEFIENPIDLFDFKTKKGGSNSGLDSDRNLYYNPTDSTKGGKYYGYSLFPSDNPELFPESPVSMTVYKYGKNKDLWNDKNEILIELSVYGNDKDLGNSNLVGTNQRSLINRFGENYIEIDSSIVYVRENKLIEFGIRNKKVSYFKFWNTKYQVLDSIIAKKIVDHKY